MVVAAILRQRGLLLGGLVGLLALALGWWFGAAGEGPPRSPRAPRARSTIEVTPIDAWPRTALEPAPQPERSAAQALPASKAAPEPGAWPDDLPDGIGRVLVSSARTGHALSEAWVRVVDAQAVDPADLRAGEQGGAALFDDHCPVKRLGDGAFEFRYEPPEPGASFQLLLLAGARGHGTRLVAREAFGERIHLGNIVLPPAAAIAGRVLDGRGRPRPGVTVHAHEAATSIDHGHQVTDDLGDFRFDDLPAGLIRVSAAGLLVPPDEREDGDFCGGVSRSRPASEPVIAASQPDEQVWDPRTVLALVRLREGETREVQIGGLHQVRVRTLRGVPPGAADPNRDSLAFDPEQADGLHFEEVTPLLFALPLDPPGGGLGLGPWGQAGSRVFTAEASSGWQGLGGLSSGTYLVGEYGSYQCVLVGPNGSAPAELDLVRREIPVRPIFPDGKARDLRVVAMPSDAAEFLSDQDPWGATWCALAALASAEEQFIDIIDDPTASAPAFAVPVPNDGTYRLFLWDNQFWLPNPPMARFPSPAGAPPLELRAERGRTCLIVLRQPCQTEPPLIYVVDEGERIVALAVGAEVALALGPGQYRVHALLADGRHDRRDLHVPAVEGPPLDLSLGD